MPLDKRSIVWGLLLSIFATGLYDVLKAFMSGNYKEEFIVFASTMIVALVLLIAFRKQLFKE